MELPAGIKLTPMLHQYVHWKDKYPDCLLFFRMGDFYEMFFKDAEIASAELDIVLTSRSKDSANAIPMAGIPFHSVESYLGKLVEAGYKVAICEQVTEPDGKNLVEREVVRVVTPGTWIPENSDSDGRIVALNIKHSQISIALLSSATGLLKAGTFDIDRAVSIITSFSPIEILLPKGQINVLENYMYIPASTNIAERDRGDFTDRNASKWLCEKWNILTLNSMGLDDTDSAVGCVYVALRYLEETQFSRAEHVKGVEPIFSDEVMILDSSTQINLELVKSDATSLYSVLNKCDTPMGKRLLKDFILAPLLNINKINMRLDAVEELIGNSELRKSLKEVLPMCKDMAKSIGRITLKMGMPSDLLVIKETLGELPKIESLVKTSPYLCQIIEMPNLSDIGNLLISSVADSVPRFIRDGGVIRRGYSEELDLWRDKAENATSWLDCYAEQERIKTGIKSLKTGVNKVFGYYIEIPKGSLDKVPLSYIRKQTLVNAERFITDDLKKFEGDIFSAEERIKGIEELLYNNIINETLKYSAEIQTAATLIGMLDVFVCFAEVSATRGYNRPVVDESFDFIVKGGRHPVIEVTLTTTPFTPNSYNFSDDSGRKIAILTGPNMAGKSTYLRTAALIAIMAHMGCYVPAEFAKIGLIDRVFTRIGAHDELSKGQSTFMVEMVETANILRHVTERSLVIIDEVGRGTSTYDGLSIAWSVLEFLHGHGQTMPRVLFATHYHELTKLPKTLCGVVNLSMAVEETDAGVVFLHKVVEGPADRSYGVEVARLAGMPSVVLKRSKALLSELENQNRQCDMTVQHVEYSNQLLLFDTEKDALLEELADIDPDSMTPMEALEKLYSLRNKSRKALDL